MVNVRLVICKICGNKLDRETAYKVKGKNTNRYFCNRKEYFDKHGAKETLSLADKIMGESLSKDIKKEITNLAEIYGYTKIYDYLSYEYDYLSKTMQEKTFNDKNHKIKYFAVILKTHLPTFNKQIKEDVKKKR